MNPTLAIVLPRIPSLPFAWGPTMKKLKLNADDLHVEEFRVQPDVAATRGTVRGLDQETVSFCPDTHGCPSADVSAPCYYCFDWDTNPTRFC